MNIFKCGDVYDTVRSTVIQAPKETVMKKEKKQAAKDKSMGTCGCGSHSCGSTQSQSQKPKNNSI